MIRVQEQDFDVGREIEKLKSGNHEIGAIVTFTGTVRSHDEPDALAKGLKRKHRNAGPCRQVS